MGTLGMYLCLFLKKKLGTALDTDVLKLCRFECFPFLIFFFTFFSAPPFSFTVPPFLVFSVSEVPDSQPYPFSFFLSFQIPTPLLLLSSETTRTPEDSGLSPYVRSAAVVLTSRRRRRQREDTAAARTVSQACERSSFCLYFCSVFICFCCCFFFFLAAGSLFFFFSCAAAADFYFFCCWFSFYLFLLFFSF